MESGVLDVAEDPLLGAAEEPHRAGGERLQDSASAEDAVAVVEVVDARGEAPAPPQAREPGGGHARPRQVRAGRVALAPQVHLGAEDHPTDLERDVVGHQGAWVAAGTVPLGTRHAGHADRQPRAGDPLRPQHAGLVAIVVDRRVPAVGRGGDQLDRRRGGEANDRAG